MKCRYCGGAAGFLATAHEECERKYRKGRQDIVALFGSPPMTPSESIAGQIEKIRSTSLIPVHEMRRLLIDGWSAAVDKFLDDGVLDQNEEHQLVVLQNQFALSQAELDSAGAY